MSSDVFFLGSGFSKAIDNNYPVLSELSREIHDNLNTEKESVGMHYRNEIPDKYKDNIETSVTVQSRIKPEGINQWSVKGAGNDSTDTNIHLP